MFNLENTKKLKSALLGVGLSTLLATSLFGSTKNEMSVDGAVNSDCEQKYIAYTASYCTVVSRAKSILIRRRFIIISLLNMLPVSLKAWKASASSISDHM